MAVVRVVTVSGLIRCSRSEGKVLGCVRWMLWLILSEVGAERKSSPYLSPPKDLRQDRLFLSLKPLHSVSVVGALIL